MQAEKKVQTDVQDWLLYANDMDNMPTQRQTCKEPCSKYHSHDNYDLTISTKSRHTPTKPTAEKPYNETTITVNGQKLKVVNEFAYLGNTLIRAVHIGQNRKSQFSIRKAPCKYLGVKRNQA